jgi:2-methylcitrate dehydratase
MVYIIATILRKAIEKYDNILEDHNIEDLWKYLMLTPFDYGKNAIFNETTRAIMDKIEFQHGGLDYDSKYPDGIPTSIQIIGKGNQTLDSGLVLYPAGHSKSTTDHLHEILQYKFKVLGKLALDK